MSPALRRDVRNWVLDYLAAHGSSSVSDVYDALPPEYNITNRHAFDQLTHRMHEIERPAYGFIGLPSQIADPFKVYPLYTRPVLEFAIKHGGITQAQARELLNRGRNQINGSLIYLRNLGLLDKEKKYNSPFVPTPKAKEIIKSTRDKSSE